MRGEEQPDNGDQRPREHVEEEVRPSFDDRRQALAPYEEASADVEEEQPPSRLRIVKEILIGCATVGVLVFAGMMFMSFIWYLLFG